MILNFPEKSLLRPPHIIQHFNFYYLIVLPQNILFQIVHSITLIIF